MFKINYFQFRIEDETCEYMKNRTLPATVAMILDPESTKLMPAEQAMKAICFSAMEFMDAFVEEIRQRSASRGGERDDS